jgi:hypothetical protein
MPPPAKRWHVARTARRPAAYELHPSGGYAMRSPPHAPRCLALARRAPPDLPPAGLAQGSTNVCSNQEGFTAGLHMCSNYLHVPGSTWPLARITSYLAVPSKRRQVHLPRARSDARPPGGAKQSASRPTEPTCQSVRPPRARRPAGRTGTVTARAEHQDPYRSRAPGPSRVSGWQATEASDGGRPPPAHPAQPDDTNRFPHRPVLSRPPKPEIPSTEPMREGER